jgi:hypothetical protein
MAASCGLRALERWHEAVQLSLILCTVTIPCSPYISHAQRSKSHPSPCSTRKMPAEQ